MKQGKVIQAYNALARLGGQTMEDYAVAYKLFRLKKQMTPAIEFQTEREKAIFDKYQPERLANGQYSFRTSGQAAEFRKELNDLAEVETEIQITPVTIPKGQRLLISMDDIEALDGFVVFPVEEEKPIKMAEDKPKA